MRRPKSCEVGTIVRDLCRKRKFQIAAEYLNTLALLRTRPRTTVGGWERLPKGWTEESLRKFWESLTGDVKHKMTKCVEKIKDVPSIDDPYAFCAALKDKMLGTTKWRKGPKGRKKKS